jgi:hypothetical protein
MQHWVAYSVENYDNVTRYEYDAIVSAYDLASTYLPAWETTVTQGKPMGVMCRCVVEEGGRAEGRRRGIYLATGDVNHGAIEKEGESMCVCVCVWWTVKAPLASGMFPTRRCLFAENA